jgi:hypothetical protein
MDRFDIAEAHAVLEWDYNQGGWLRERPSNQRRMEATSVQLQRIGFRARPDLCFENLEDDGKEVYLTNVLRWWLPIDDQVGAAIKAFFTPEFIASFRHPGL